MSPQHPERDPEADTALPGGTASTVPALLESGRFVVLGQLGRGGMGIVHEVLDRELGHRVALKTLPEVDPDAVLRFKNEFRALQDIAHPNLVELGELFEEGGRWFFTMELVQGIDFVRFVRGAGVFTPGSTRTHAPSAQTADTRAGPRDEATMDAPASAFRRAATVVSGPPAPGQTSALGPVTARDAATLAGSPAAAGAVRGSQPPARPSGAPSAPPAGPGFDEERLRMALAQLARGLMALHRADKVHRDIKPSNVLVTPSGDVKILDFGLVSDALRSFVWKGELMVGTPGYMAPEQVSGLNVGPEADWYAVGVMLYVALTGRPPFIGVPSTVLRLKNERDPPPPSSLNPAVPPDLDALCMDLLQRDPRSRAGGRAIQERLRIDRSSSFGAAEHIPFVGRGEELAACQDAFEASTHGAVTLVVHGESGVGKSTLVAQFTERLRELPGGAIVVAGRCYERESVPYKAVDGIVDALSDALLTMPEHEVQAVLPRDVALLTQVFPVLRRVPAMAAEAARSEAAAASPDVLRARLFESFHDLVRRLTARRRLAIVIDDLQWTDADSLALLTHLLRPGLAPPLLLMATMRVASELLATEQAPAADVELPGEVRHIQLGGLPDGEAQDLAVQLLYGLGQVDEESARAIAREANGHPLFIDELVRHARSLRAMAEGAEVGPREVRLDEAIGARMRTLGATTRRMLDIIAVAGVPLAIEALALATGVERSELRSRLGRLRGAKLVRTTGARSIDVVETYHDRVRAAVNARLDHEGRKMLHGRLALAFERTADPEPEALARHWAEAGHPERAVEYALRAAQRASGLFAFHRAADMYALAAKLSGEDRRAAAAHRIAMGEALVYAGQGQDAAQAYLDVADGGDVDAETRFELNRRAATQLLAGGVFNRGMEVMNGVLASAGMSVPRRPLASMLLRRAQLRLRGLDYELRPEAEIPKEILRKADVCFTAVLGLGMKDPVVTADFQARQLLAALEAGEPFRLCRALVSEVMQRALEGEPNATRSREALRATEALVQRTGSPPAMVAFLSVARAGVLHFEGRFAEAIPLFDHAETLYGRAWTESTNSERDGLRMFRNAAYVWCGRFRLFNRAVDESLENIRVRRLVYAKAFSMTGIHTMVWLAQGQVDRARHLAEEALKGWSSDRMHVPVLLDAFGRGALAVWDGDHARGFSLVDGALRRARRAHLLRSQYLRVNALETRARFALAGAAAAPLGAHRDKLLAVAAGDAARLIGEGVAWSRANGFLARAGVARARGDATGALRDLGIVIPILDTLDHALQAAAARHVLGHLVKGDEGAALIRRAEAVMTAQGVTDVARFVRLLAPGFDV